MLPSAVIVEATIRSAKLERAERSAHALPSAPDANPPPYSRRPTRNLEPINRRVIEPATLPSHSSTSVVREKYVSQNRISNRNSAKNRSYRKQTTKPSLTETRIAFLPGLPRAILANGFALQNRISTRFWPKYRMRRNLLKTNHRTNFYPGPQPPASSPRTTRHEGSIRGFLIANCRCDEHRHPEKVRPGARREGPVPHFLIAN